LLRRIGGGSYGEVWLARSVIGAFRAVKVVYRDEFPDAKPFEREFAGIQRFEPISRLHDSQVDILHVGRNQECFYYIMELADDESTGQDIDPARYVPRTLRSEIRRRGKLPLEACLEIALSLTTALEHLHSHNLVHRDIKPSNIIFVHGSPKLADIGLVTGTDATRSYVGTVGYIPPEGPGTPQADFYSLGKVLYELSTGKDRDDFPEPPTILEEKSGPCSWLEFHEILLKACESDPGRRYRSAQELRAELELLRGGKSVRRMRTLERRLFLLSRLGLAAAALLILTAAGYLFSMHETRVAKREAHRADQLAARALQAEAAAREQLYDSLLAQAQARRRSNQPGRRFESLEAIRKAAEIHPSTALRSEAIACLALSDLRPEHQWNAYLPNTKLVAFDADFQRYARADDTGGISIRRITDDQEIQQLPAQGVPAESNLGFSPDGRSLGVFYDRGGLEFCLWDLATASMKMKASGLRGRCFGFSPDSRLLALGQHSGPILIFDLATGNCIRTFRQTILPYFTLFSPEGSRLAVSSGSFVQIRDAESGRVLHSLEHSNGVRGISWHPAGRFLASACADQNVYVWDTIEERLQQKLAGHQGDVVGINYNHSGDLLASSAWDNTLKLWDAIDGRLIISASSMGCMGFGSDDHQLCYSTDGANSVLGRIQSSKECKCLNIDPTVKGSEACDFSPDGRLLVSCHRDGVRVWDVESRAQVAFVPELELHCARLHPTGGLFTGGGGGLKKRALTHSVGSGSIEIGPGSLFGNAPVPVLSFSWTADGRSIAFPVVDRAYLFDAESMEPKLQLNLETQLYSFDMNPDGRWAAGAPRKQTAARVWSLDGSGTIQDLPCPGVNHVSFSPDNQWLVTGSGIEYAFWRTGSWTAEHRITRSNTGGLRGCSAFSRDSRIAALVHSAQTVRLINTATGQELATFEMPDQQVITGLAFSLDGSKLAVCGRTSVIYIWDLDLIRAQLGSINLAWD
jgi:WD40 repeat protein